MDSSWITIVGSVLFTIFGGVGIACLPLGLIFSFIRRPKAVITRSQYIKLCVEHLRQEATELGKKARELKKAADVLHQEERSGNKGRKEVVTRERSGSCDIQSLI